MNIDLTSGPIIKKIFLFSIPLMLGNLLQQLYNIVDTFVVGRVIGASGLAAVGSSYTLMTFLTSIIIGLCMGSAAYFAWQFGNKDDFKIKQGLFIAFCFTSFISLLINILVYLSLDFIIYFLNIPLEIIPLIKEYLWIIFGGIQAVFIYNFIANVLRSQGNSIIPLVFLGISTICNIILDILFVYYFHLGIGGAAKATIISQWLSAILMIGYYYLKCKDLHLSKIHCHFDGEVLKKIISLSTITSLQQSIMNFGILLVQGLVNSFGTIVMAAFAAGVKIDSFAYSPVQDFGNAFSTYVGQNYGAKKMNRIKEGLKKCLIYVSIFSITISLLVNLFSRQLLCLFIDSNATDILQVGQSYLRIEGLFYVGIGILFLWYGYFRAISKPTVSLILTIISLGTRVLLAYILSGIIGVNGIFVSIPIGWFLADVAGYYYKRKVNI